MKIAPTYVFIVASAVFVGGALFSFPVLLDLQIERLQNRTSPTVTEQFPVSVDPKNKVIVENAQANAFFENIESSFQATVANTGRLFGLIFEWIALSVAEVPWYQRLAAAEGSRFVSVTPGMRKEQVANAFARTLAWDSEQKKAFLTASADAPLPLSEGSFAPGIYSIAFDTTPEAAQTLVNDRFTQDVLSHYGPETAQKVPLEQALTIASLIERETGGRDDMRIISGIIWNRLFIGMNLQIDATLQYATANAKTNTAATGAWWPKSLPADIYRKSPYNTYLNPGLPPTPIANPSVTTIVAALNPKKTSCLFYFHDAARQFHCTDTYKEHVALLKKYYGRGK